MLLFLLIVGGWLIAGLIGVLLNFSLEDFPFNSSEPDRAYCRNCINNVGKAYPPEPSMVASAIALGLAFLCWVGIKSLTRGLWRAKQSNTAARAELEKELADARRQVDDFLSGKRPEEKSPAEVVVTGRGPAPIVTPSPRPAPAAPAPPPIDIYPVFTVGFAGGVESLLGQIRQHLTKGEILDIESSRVLANRAQDSSAMTKVFQATGWSRDRLPTNGEDSTLWNQRNWERIFS